MVRAMTAASARHLLFASLIGLLYPLCFPGYDHGWLAFFVLVPLHLAIADAPPRPAFWLGWLAGLVAFVGTMFWVVTAMHLYGKMPLIIAYGVMLLLAAYLGLYVALYSALLTWVRRGLPHVGLLAAPFIWVALELVRTYAFSGLPWALFGYSQYRWLTAIQIADVTGVYGVSFYLVLVNVALTEIAVWMIQHRAIFQSGMAGRAGLSFDRLRTDLLHTLPRLVPTLTLLTTVIVLGYGAFRLFSQTGGSDGPAVRIGAVQPNIDQAQKWDDAFRRETMDRYIRLTRQVGRGSDLIVWPEAATPFLFEQETPYRLELTALVHAQGAPLLFGSPAVRYYANRRPYLLNSAYLFSADGEILGRYDKQHLVPFGEYIPLRTVLFFLDKLVEGIGDFEAGTLPTVLTLPGTDRQPTKRRPTKFGVVICFEVIFPNLVREFVRDGAQFMVTITNDAWFGQSVAPHQHFGMVVFRAVENHVGFARAANTGISGFIAPTGRILAETPIFTEAAIQGSVPLGRGPTFYSRNGDLFAYGCVIITGIFAAAAAIRPPMNTSGRKNRRP
jgi:apolipoprotein N-acyltransferase